MFSTTARAMAAFISFVALTGAAAASEWRVVKVTGDLWMESPGVQRVALSSPADNVPDGATLVTGANSRVLLSRGSETIVIGPNSVMAIPKQVGQFTTIEQRAGEADFDVEKQNLQHFAVETPFLAAVVKGTQFTVRVGTADATVSVARGLVEVGNLATGQTADVAPGQSVAVDGKTGRMTAVGNVDIKSGMPRLQSVKPMSSQDVLALQSAPKGAGPSDGKPFDVADAGSAIAAVRVGGPGNGPGAGPAGGFGGNPSPGAGPVAGGKGVTPAAFSSGDGSFTVATASASVEPFQPRRSARSSEPDVSSLTWMIVAASFALMALLGIGFAYVRARF